jgi:hypothetical protein
MLQVPHHLWLEFFNLQTHCQLVHPPLLRIEEVLFLYYEKELIELILSRCEFSVGQLAHHYHALLLLCTQIDWCCNLPCLNCRYGAIPCQMDYLFIDGVAVLSLGYSMNLSNPQKKLSQVWKPMPLCIRSSLNYIKIPVQNFAIQSRLASQETCNDMKTTISGVVGAITIKMTHSKCSQCLFYML